MGSNFVIEVTEQNVNTIRMEFPGIRPLLELVPGDRVFVSDHEQRGIVKDVINMLFPEEKKIPWYKRLLFRYGS